MSVAAPTSSARGGGRPRVALRPLVLPTEHGGWGFLFEPLILGLAVRPSSAGSFLALAAILGFLSRQPLKYAMQDALRAKSYPRTSVCRRWAAGYLAGAAGALAIAISLGGLPLFIPFGLVAPLALMVIAYDARNRSRSLLPELGGAVAMSSTAASIAIAGGMRIVPALALSGIVIARSIPSIVYVRTLVQRAHGNTASSTPAIALHALAIPAVALVAPPLATVAIAVLFVRAVWGLAHQPPRAQTLGWREISWGLVTVVLSATAYLS